MGDLVVIIVAVVAFVLGLFVQAVRAGVDDLRELESFEELLGIHPPPTDTYARRRRRVRVQLEVLAALHHGEGVGLGAFLEADEGSW